MILFLFVICSSDHEFVAGSHGRWAAAESSGLKESVPAGAMIESRKGRWSEDEAGPHCLAATLQASHKSPMPRLAHWCLVSCSMLDDKFLTDGLMEFPRS